jgi:hypothetical protein
VCAGLFSGVECGELVLRRETCFDGEACFEALF